MSIITALEPQQRRAGRINVFVDGQFIIGVGEGVAASLRLRLGQEITPERLTEIASAEELHRATEAAYTYLETRARSEKEVRDRLSRDEYPDEVITQVIDKLREMTLLDDSQFAKQWVQAKTNVAGSRPVGRRRISSQLYQKGVHKDTIGKALAEVTDDDEIELARAAARKKVRALSDDPEIARAERQRLIAFLQRRGFSWETCKRVADESFSPPEDAFDDEDPAEE
ncbi:regulatory protein RecX [Capsulimonas corticalis]|uniref:Regulatory protein RecX n=1 Tax=Capsulimonas corticalis TaxID=2219043 RepID=A0A402D460_9BACT|nr:RecX family transcriptional regulator [Capsulimonas corticalis]BDI29222.1 regulatory protein RecX [Capsulimonas corticalis]